MITAMFSELPFHIQIFVVFLVVVAVIVGLSTVSAISNLYFDPAFREMVAHEAARLCTAAAFAFSLSALITYLHYRACITRLGSSPSVDEKSQGIELRITILQSLLVAIGAGVIAAAATFIALPGIDPLSARILASSIYGLGFFIIMLFKKAGPDFCGKCFRLVVDQAVASATKSEIEVPGSGLAALIYFHIFIVGPLITMTALVVFALVRPERTLVGGALFLINIAGLVFGGPL